MSLLDDNIVRVPQHPIAKLVAAAFRAWDLRPADDQDDLHATRAQILCFLRIGLVEYRLVQCLNPLTRGARGSDRILGKGITIGLAGKDL